MQEKLYSIYSICKFGQVGRSNSRESIQVQVAFRLKLVCDAIQDKHYLIHLRFISDSFKAQQN